MDTDIEIYFTSVRQARLAAHAGLGARETIDAGCQAPTCKFGARAFDPTALATRAMIFFEPAAMTFPVLMHYGCAARLRGKARGARDLSDPSQASGPTGSGRARDKVAPDDGDREMGEHMSVIFFVDDEKEYLLWLTRNPLGFVVNTYRKPSPAYLVLHQASCPDISSSERENYTTRDYSKVCATERYTLTAWARDLGGQLTRCERCSP